MKALSFYILWLTALIMISSSISANEARYIVSLRDIDIGELYMDIEFAENKYESALRFNTIGFAQSLFNSTIEANAKGEGLSFEKLTPTQFERIINDDGKKSRIWFNFSEEVIENLNSEPSRPASIDPKSQKGAIDPLTALTYLLRPISEENVCAFRVRLFDGYNSQILTVSEATKRRDGRLQCGGSIQFQHGYIPEQINALDNIIFTILYRPDRTEGAYIVDRLRGKSPYGDFQLLKR